MWRRYQPPRENIKYEILSVKISLTLFTHQQLSVNISLSFIRVGSVYKVSCRMHRPNVSQPTVGSYALPIRAALVPSRLESDSVRQIRYFFHTICNITTIFFTSAYTYRHAQGVHWGYVGLVGLWLPSIHSIPAQQSREVQRSIRS